MNEISKWTTAYTVQQVIVGLLWIWSIWAWYITVKEIFFEPQETKD